MKKFKGLSILLCVVLMVIAFAGCSKEKDEVATDAKTSAPTAETSAPATTEPETTETEKTPETTNEVVELPGEFPMGMSFLSGAGGWATDITINKDGTFIGMYSDSEMGSTGPGYSGGTIYICEFSGKFDIVEKIDETSYFLNLVDITVKDYGASEWIEDNIKYIVSDPYGLESGEDFILYTPDKKVSELSEDFLLWWPLRYDTQEYSTLSVYGLHNLETDYGFFSQPY